MWRCRRTARKQCCRLRCCRFDGAGNLNRIDSKCRSVAPERHFPTDSGARFVCSKVFAARGSFPSHGKGPGARDRVRTAVAEHRRSGWFRLRPLRRSGGCAGCRSGRGVGDFVGAVGVRRYNRVVGVNRVELRRRVDVRVLDVVNLIAVGAVWRTEWFLGRRVVGGFQPRWVGFRRVGFDIGSG